MHDERYQKRENRSQLLSVTVTPSDRSLIAAAAIRTGMSVASFVARAASKAARTELSVKSEPQPDEERTVARSWKRLQRASNGEERQK